MIEQTIQKLYACRKKETELLIEMLAELLERIEQETEIHIDTAMLDKIIVTRYEKRISELERKLAQVQEVLQNK